MIVVNLEYNFLNEDFKKVCSRRIITVKPS